jgi:hypothetical protein
MKKPNQRKVHNVYLDNLILQPRLALLLLAGGADGGEVGDDLLGVLRLTRSRLAAVTRGLAVDLTIKGWVFPPLPPPVKTVRTVHNYSTRWSFHTSHGVPLPMQYITLLKRGRGRVLEPWFNSTKVLCLTPFQKA